MIPDPKLLESLEASEEVRHVAHVRMLCEEILKQAPNDLPTLFSYTRCLTELCLFSEAEEVLEHIKSIIPPKLKPIYHAGQGHLRESMGDFPESFRQHMIAHELKPDDCTYLVYAGSIAFRSGDISRAEKLARQAIQCSEGCLDEAFYNLGGYLLVQKKYNEARECYLKALEIDPDYTEAKDRLEDLDKVQCQN